MNNDQVFLEIENLHIQYGVREVLRGASMAIREGEVVAIFGPNGAGKSSLVKAIAGLIRPDRGRVLLAGQDITGLAIHQRRRMGICYLAQGGPVFPSLTVNENLVLAIPRNGRNDSRFDDLLSVFPALRGLLPRRAGLLSGGQRQMLALAMAVAGKPRLLLLDEPSIGLAPEAVETLFARLRELIRSQCLTVLLVEQRIREAQAIADREFRLIDTCFVQMEKAPAPVRAGAISTRDGGEIL